MYDNTGIGGEARSGVTSGVPRETSSNEHVTPHLHREYEQPRFPDPPRLILRQLRAEVLDVHVELLLGWGGWLFVLFRSYNMVLMCMLVVSVDVYC